MTQSTQSSSMRRPPALQDADIFKLFNDVRAKRVTDAQKTFSKEDMCCMGYTVAGFVEAVQKIVDYPSQYKVEQFQEACHDPQLIYALRDPHVSFGLELKKSYDMGRLPLFDIVREFAQNTPVEIEYDPIIEKFMKIYPQFMPLLLEIQDPALSEKVLQNNRDQDLRNLAFKGKRYYENIVNEILLIRFSDEDIQYIAQYTSHHKVAAQWSVFYDIPIDERPDPSLLFFAYVGALSIANVGWDRQREIFQWISGLIEPILMQFDETRSVLSDAKINLAEKLGEIDYKLIHKTEMDGNPYFVVQAYGGNEGTVFLGMASDADELEAENKVASCVLSNTGLLKRCERIIEDSYQETYDTNNTEQANEYSNYYSNGHNAAVPPQQQGSIPVQPIPGSTAPQYPYTAPPVQPVYGFSGYQYFRTDEQGQPIAGTAGAYGQGGTDTPVMSTELTTTGYGSQVINPDFQRRLQETNQQVDLAPILDESVAVDSVFKERLNQMLIANRIEPAEYKTAKLNNSDVQVTCFIENIPIARAISTNKKKAGQLVAQFILNNTEKYLTRFFQR